MTENCICCGNKKTSKVQFWTHSSLLWNIWVFCSTCCDLISHNAYHQPNNPGAYMMILLKELSNLSKIKHLAKT